MISIPTRRRRKGAGAHSAPPRGRRPRPARPPASKPAVGPAAVRRPVSPKAAAARRAGRRRLIAIGVVAALVALAVTGLVVANTSLFAARNITVVGAVHTSRSEILAASGLAAHPPLVDVNPGAASAAIERLPWIGRATVTVSFPDDVRIVVTERTPVAYLPLGRSGAALVDLSRRVLADVARRPTSLAGLSVSGTPPAPGERLPSSDQALVETAAVVPASLVARIVSVMDEQGSGIVLTLRAAPRAILGSTSDLAEKFVSLDTVLNGVALNGIVAIDLRAPSNPVLTP